MRIPRKKKKKAYKELWKKLYRYKSIKFIRSKIQITECNL